MPTYLKCTQILFPRSISCLPVFLVNRIHLILILVCFFSCLCFCFDSLLEGTHDKQPKIPNTNSNAKYIMNPPHPTKFCYGFGKENNESNAYSKFDSTYRMNEWILNDAATVPLHPFSHSLSFTHLSTSFLFSFPLSLFLPFLIWLSTQHVVTALAEFQWCWYMKQNVATYIHPALFTTNCIKLQRRISIGFKILYVLSMHSEKFYTWIVINRIKW